MVQISQQVVEYCELQLLVDVLLVVQVIDVQIFVVFEFGEYVIVYCIGQQVMCGMYVFDDGCVDFIGDGVVDDFDEIDWVLFVYVCIFLVVMV